MNRPQATAGLRHVALYVNRFDECLHFYVELLGMQVEWRPDDDNIYLTSGVDNLALHRSEETFSGHQHLDHIGFILNEPAQVQQWYDFLAHHGVDMRTRPKQHRDGAHSFYCFDPDGNTVQFIYHPPLAGV